MTDSEPDRELVLTRVFAAPCAQVYQAFVDPDQLGPVGFSVPRESVEIDARAGGYQRFVMVNDNDPSFRSPVDATFTEVIENELLVGNETWEGVRGMQGAGTMAVRIDSTTRARAPASSSARGPTRARWREWRAQAGAAPSPSSTPCLRANVSAGRIARRTLLPNCDRPACGGRSTSSCAATARSSRPARARGGGSEARRARGGSRADLEELVRLSRVG